MNTNDHPPAISGDNPPAWRQKLIDRLESDAMRRIVVGIIVINLVILGILSMPLGQGEIVSWALVVANRLCIGIFVVELLLKAMAYRSAAFKDGWYLFDVLVVAAAIIPALGSSSSALRGLRALHLFRLISVIPSLRKVVNAFLRALPGVGAIGLLMLFFLYISAIMANGLFGSAHPESFGHLGKSIYTLFQVMTLEGWSLEVVEPTMETHPWAWALFIPFIIFGAFTILNLFIGVIVSTMQELDIPDKRKDSENTEALELVERLERDLAELRRRLDETPGK